MNKTKTLKEHKESEKKHGNVVIKELTLKTEKLVGPVCKN